jgi:hypothetical protein
MHFPRNIPSIRRVRAIARLREHRQARAQEAVRTALSELRRLSVEIEQLTADMEKVRAERQSLYEALPESMSRSRLLELKRREHRCETRRIDINLEITRRRTEQEEAERGLLHAKQNLAEAQRSLSKIEHVQKSLRVRSAGIELMQMEIENGEYHQYR